MHKRAKKSIGIIVISLLLIAGFFALAKYQSSRPPQAKCEDPGLMAPGTLTIEGFAKRSGLVAIGEVHNISKGVIEVDINEILKGNGAKRHDHIILCPSQVSPVGVEAGNNVLIFLEGKDKNVWALTWPYDGLMHIKGEQVESSKSKKTYNMRDIREAIKEQN